MKNLPRYIDLAFCLLVLPVMFIMFPIERWYHNFQTYFTCLGIWLYSLYIINRAYTVPALFKSGKKPLGGLAVIVLSLLITYIFSSICLYTPPPNRLDEGIVRLFPAVKQYQQAVWSLFMIVEAYSFAVGLLTQNERQRSQRMELEVQRDQAEINLYKAQIKPHFMFNTLNSLYSLFLTKSDKALPSLEKYIKMMRYIHTAACRELIPLSEEADYIRQLVELQTLRLNEKTKVELTIEIEHQYIEIPPMLLVTFVENCFKHGVSPVEESRITISLTEKEGVLTLLTSNRVFPVKRRSEHLGLANCRKRLSLIYPEAHSLTTNESEGLYTVELIMELNKRSDKN